MLLLHMGWLLRLWDLDTATKLVARTTEQNDVLIYCNEELDRCKHFTLTQQVMSDLWLENCHSPLVLVVLSDI